MADPRQLAIEEKLQSQIVLWAMKRVRAHHRSYRRSPPPTMLTRPGRAAQALRDELLKPEYSVSAISAAVPEAMRSLSLEPKLRNLIYDVAQQMGGRFAANGRPVPTESEGVGSRGWGGSTRLGTTLAAATAGAGQVDWALGAVPGKGCEDTPCDASSKGAV